ncbi:MAG: family 78 glycoside hydrolase catalytic domain [Bacteroidales bacterium]|nr:family 78 glycoside hydrolase catalytic domain [Bacteroidales bacterium]
MRRFLILLASLSIALPTGAQLKIDCLRTMGLENPQGIDPASEITLSWILESSKHATFQQAYELTLKSGSRTVWRSGKVQSDNSVRVPVDAALTPGTAYSWTVKVWDNHGEVSKPVSASFSTGLAKDGWKASWIGTDTGDKTVCPTPVYFRRTLRPSASVKRAVAYVTSHGIYEFKLNGAKVGDDYLTPGWTAYNKTLQYQAYDVTSSLRKGVNEIGVLVSPGWYGSGMGWGAPKDRLRYGSDIALLFQLEIEYTSGKKELIVSGPDWEMSRKGPVSDATMYDGETIDYTADYAWERAEVLPGGPARLVSSVAEPVRVREVLEPVKSFVTPKGEKVLDFGQNLVGWEKLRIKGRRGQVIKVSHAEVLDKEGNFYTKNMRAAKVQSTFVLSGGEDVFEPCHTFYGFRYIRVEGIEGELDPSCFSAVVADSGFETVGSFECSNPVINQLQSNIFWGFRGNFVDIPTDCPQRDERLGWTGDAEFFFRTATFNGKVDNFFRKWLKSLSDEQNARGGIPAVIPDIFFGGNVDFACGWADCATIIPWQHYMAYGDLKVLRDQYPSMKAWVDFQLGACDKYLLNTLKQPFGDWLFWSQDNDRSGKSAVTSKALCAQCFMAGSIDIVAKSAELLGLAEDAAFYKGELAKVKKAYMDEYVTPNGLISSDTQTAYVLALYFDMLPEALRQQAADRLAANVESYGNHITTGFLGTPHICEVLSEYGYTDVAYKLLLQESCPSWIYPIRRGATTIWERWDSIKPDGSIVGGMNSFNHYSYGSIGDWLYRYAVGIRETQAGFKTFVVDPHPGGGFKYMEASTRTPYGKIRVRWEADGDVIRSIEVSIPAGTTAEVHCPGGQVRVLGSGNYGFGVELE